MTGLYESNARKLRNGARAPSTSRPSLLRRLASAIRSVPPDIEATRARQLSDISAVLDGARAIVERGWVQNAWFVRTASAPRATVTATAATATTVPAGFGDDGTGVTGACLVGAVVRASRQHPGAVAGPAIDVLWDAWQENRGLGGPGLAGPVPPPQVRIARVRDLTRWNDQPGRTRDEVVRLIDVASSRAVMTAMRLPHGSR
jgi:hypothetical protein